MLTSFLYTLCIILSFAVPYTYIFFSTAKDRRKTILQIELLSFVTAVFGALIYTVITSAFSGKIVFGLSAYGAAMGLFLGLLLYKKLYNPPDFKQFFDRFVLCVPAIYGISKTACLIRGCCGGRIGPIPIQLAETAVFIVIYFLCTAIYKKTNNIAWVILLSAIAKGTLESFRDGFQILSANFITSIIFILISIPCILFYNKRTESKGKEENI